MDLNNIYGPKNEINSRFKVPKKNEEIIGIRIINPSNIKGFFIRDSKKLLIAKKLKTNAKEKNIYANNVKSKSSISENQNLDEKIKNSPA